MSPSSVIAVIVIFQPASFLHKLLAWVLLGMASLTHAQQLDISLGEIEHPAFKAKGLQITFDTFRAGQADIAVEEFTTADIHLRKLKLHCNKFKVDDVHLKCDEGSLRQGEQAPVLIALSFGFADKKLTISLHNVDLAMWGASIKVLQHWHPLGHIDVVINADQTQIKADAVLRNLGFNTDDFSIVAEKIMATASLTAQRKGVDWAWQASAKWSSGEALWSPWYRKAGVQLTGEGLLTTTQLKVEQARLSFDRLGSATLGLNWDLKAGVITRWGFVTDPLDLSVAVKEWVQPVLDAHALPAISATGITRYAAEWSGGNLQSFYAGIEHATLKESSGRLTLNDVNASVPWSSKEESVAEITVGSGMLDDFALGGFTIPVHLHGTDVSVSRVSMPFLDGRLKLDDIHALRASEAWTGRFSGAIEGVSMARLAAAMGLPPLVGSMSMRIPDASYADHVLDLGGDMSLDVFDGHIVARHLKLIEPFSSASRVTADVEARRLDLGLLTSAFSFGSILGRLDIDIKGLELQNWKPLAFNARLTSSPGDYRRAISRGALIDISSIGGAAGAAAVRAIPAAGFFNTFSYDRIGFGCALKDKVCHMDGIAPENEGYVLVEGHGIPAIKVMGYNRSIDWDLLVSRLKAVIAGNTKAVIQ